MCDELYLCTTQPDGDQDGGLQRTIQRKILKFVHNFHSDVSNEDTKVKYTMTLFFLLDPVILLLSTSS